MHILNWKLISESCPTGKPYLGTTQKIFADSRLSRLKTKKQNNKDSRSFPNLSWFLFSFLNHKSSSLSPNISNIALGGFTVFVSCFLFFTYQAHITSMLTIHHITFVLTADPFQSMPTVQGYFGMAFEYTIHVLRSSVFLQKITLHSVDRDHHLCLMMRKDNRWPKITFPRVSTWHI